MQNDRCSTKKVCDSYCVFGFHPIDQSSIILLQINCYFNNANKDETSINLESLINIIAHLRENFSLDESKSSLLEAHTVEQFILEKYPHFKFENGTVEPASESDFYLAASLLLFFVCVNSKQIDIKNVMCNKLSADDQEVILKFSKNLMESSPVLYQDLQAAITGKKGMRKKAKKCILGTNANFEW